MSAVPPCKPTRASLSPSPGSESVTADATIGQAVRKSRQGVSPIPNSGHMGSHEDEGDSRIRVHSACYDAVHSACYDAVHTPTAQAQEDDRRKKRVSCNRTKTGCMTCRRRKKKCDEQKRECG